MNKTDALIVFVRNPELGKVKTRIAEELGIEKTLLVYIELLRYTFHTISKLDVELCVFVADDSQYSFQHNLQLQVYQQHGDDLGEKMYQAFQTIFDKGYSKAVIIGSDNYEISAQIIEQAFEKLNTLDCVIGPAYDGGYYLLGMNKLHTSLFKNIEWSSSKTYKQTIEAIQSHNLTYQTLQVLNDVDTVEDIKRYNELLKIIEQ